MAKRTEFAFSLAVIGALALAAPAAAKDGQGQPKATTAACSPMEHLGAAIASIWSSNRCRSGGAKKAGDLGQGNSGKAAVKPGGRGTA